jgi:hypothetical protein
MLMMIGVELQVEPEVELTLTGSGQLTGSAAPIESPRRRTIAASCRTK